MDHGKLITVIKQFPQVWDRNCATFREQNLKNDAWERIAQIMNQPANVCKDNFKSLREKYVREREKQAFWGEKYIRWLHLDSLAFLDPHIILRKQSYDADCTKSEDSTSTSASHHIEDAFLAQFSDNHSDFDRSLIELVKKASPIWDRRSNGYPSKQVKYQLWRSIAQTLKKDVNVCMMRWKGLREKYIRQRSKFHEGEGKWEFLDEMNFLDKVIQYRKKNHDQSDYVYRHDVHDLPFQVAASPQNDSYDDNSRSNDFVAAVKCEDYSSCDNFQDSFDSGTSSGRKRLASDNSEGSFEKRERVESLKSPEVMFGELVAAMLVKKTERDKNVAMIEIMKILTK